MTVSANAYDQQSFVAEYYDYLPPIADRNDREFYVDSAQAAGGEILELGCGTGRILLPLAATGQCVTGLDLSRHMLERCRAKLAACPAELRQRVQLVQGDMTDFHFDREFPLIIVPFRAFQHLLGVEAQLSCLRCVHRCLADGGKLILDFFQTDPRRMHDPKLLEEWSPHPEITLPDGRRVRLCERTVAFHRAEQCNEVELIYYVSHPEGRKERLVFPFTIRYFFRYEVEHMLSRCGFRVLELFGGFDRSPLIDASPEMIFVAQKAVVSPAPASSRT